MKKNRKPKPPKKQALVAIVMGSDSDFTTMREAGGALELLDVPFSMEIISAHRTPREMVAFAETARSRGYRAIIAGAGGAAHLPGMIAALTELPVIGVPVAIGALEGEDALLSIVQMPKGVPVATVAIGNAWNAGILAAQMIGINDPELLDRVAGYKDSLRKKVLSKKLRT
ncbi:MAG: 5-(carboxyamino)imidazole ribonucleotide mutase [Bdellovibrionales bacterium RIFOXYD1_FULL_55_31]|nr:MAG: 5-(carboxyamino)imidazole ribonucleotide mutase [Bdellovibrionales bacterium RIFOXYD1_FULL_55_31]